MVQEAHQKGKFSVYTVVAMYQCIKVYVPLSWGRVFDPTSNVWSLSPYNHVSNVLTASGSGDTTYMATEPERPIELEEHSNYISITNPLRYEEVTPASDSELYSDHSEQSFDLLKQQTGRVCVFFRHHES